ncbi:MAG: aryl-sulfate sulfotransferase [Terriglobia bacterium]
MRSRTSRQNGDCRGRYAPLEILAKFAFWTFLLLMAGVLTGCGGPGQSAELVLTPHATAVAVGQSVQFSASLTGGGSGSVAWSVNGVPAGNAATGLISSAGLFTAPSVSAPTTFNIQAVSTANSAATASATVYVFVPGTVAATANPLVAQYSILTFPNSTVAVQFGPTQSYGLNTWAVPATSSGPTSVLVAGMKASTTYHLQGVVQLANGIQFADADNTFTTSAVSAGPAPDVTTTTTPGATPAGGVELLALSGSSPVSAAATDLEGNLVWYYSGGCSGTIPNPVKLLPNGHMLVNYSADSGVDGTDSLLQEIDLAGNVIWQMTAADLNQALAAAGFNLTVVGTHHDFAVLPNGHLILIASMYQTYTDLVGYPGATNVLGDVLIDLDQNHVPVWTWSSFDYLDVNRHLLNFPPDWTHTNAILYSPSDGDLVISMRHQSWLIKIDYANGAGTGAIVWKLGWQGDFTLAGGTDPVDWFYAQHGPYFATPDTTSGEYELGLFDNGDNAPDAEGTDCGTAPTAPCQSRAQIFQINESAQTATIAWQDELPIYSYWGGNMDGLSNGDVEFDECSPSAATNSAVYEVTPVSNPQTVWQMQITGQNAYRAFRIPSLYPGVQW